MSKENPINKTNVNNPDDSKENQGTLDERLNAAIKERNARKLGAERPSKPNALAAISKALDGVGSRQATPVSPQKMATPMSSSQSSVPNNNSNNNSNNSSNKPILGAGIKKDENRISSAKKALDAFINKLESTPKNVVENQIGGLGDLGGFDNLDKLTLLDSSSKPVAEPAKPATRALLNAIEVPRPVAGATKPLARATLKPVAESAKPVVGATLRPVAESRPIARAPRKPSAGESPTTRVPRPVAGESPTTRVPLKPSAGAVPATRAPLKPSAGAVPATRAPLKSSAGAVPATRAPLKPVAESGKSIDDAIKNLKIPTTSASPKASTPSKAPMSVNSQINALSQPKPVVGNETPVEHSEETLVISSSIEKESLGVWSGGNQEIVDVFGVGSTLLSESEGEANSIFRKAFESEEDAEKVITPIGLAKKNDVSTESTVAFGTYGDGTQFPSFDEDKEFMSKVDEAWLDKGSNRAKYLTIMFSSLLVFFVAWAAFASIDEVARGQGQVIPSQRTQLIQHLEGGILNDILVKEGETVEPGQILVRVDNVTAESLLRDTESQIVEATLSVIRLEAELDDVPLVFPEQYSITVPEIVAAQVTTYNSRRLQQESSEGILVQQLEQKHQGYNEASSRKNTYEQALELVNKRVDLAEPLVRRRLYPTVDFLNLQQEAVKIRGDIAAVNNAIAKTQAEIDEVEQRISFSRREFETSIVQELNELRGMLATLRENQTAGSDRVTRTEMRSQIRGIVNRILLNTRGGVVKPGESIMEIVPIDDTLVIETKVRPQDIAFIHPKQKAIVRVSAYDASIYGGMEAIVEQIGADTVTDERGDIFFLVKVRTHDNAIYHKGETLPIMPGMVASVDILTGKKTVLSYLLKPITKASQYALKER